MQCVQPLYSVAEGDQLSVCVELVLPEGTDTLDSEITVPISATSGPRAGSYYYWLCCKKKHSASPKCIIMQAPCGYSM